VLRQREKFAIIGMNVLGEAFAFGDAGSEPCILADRFDRENDAAFVEDEIGAAMRRILPGNFVSLLHAFPRTLGLLARKIGVPQLAGARYER
jgi:hypothetical protein